MPRRNRPPSERREALRPRHLRSCVACRVAAPKHELIRMVADGHGIAVDLAMTSPGRGAYVHRNEGCVAEAIRQGRLARALRVAIEREEASNLLRELRGAITAS